MGFLSGLKQLLGGEAATEEGGDKQAIKVDFAKAIQAHTKWKHRLEDYIAGTSSEDLDPDVVSKDNQCDLGKWIYGQGMELFAQDPAFQSLREKHATFHRLAGKIVESKLDLQDDQAKEIMAGEYAAVSSDVIYMLSELHHECCGTHH